MPKHYVLRIEPAPGNERFTGRAEIDIEVLKPVESIALNASGLSFSSALLASGGHTPQIPMSTHPEWTARNVDEIGRVVQAMIVGASVQSVCG